MKKLLKRKSVVTTVLVPLAVTLGIVTASFDVFAQASHTYTGVTQEVFDTCIKPPESNKRFGDGWAEYTAGNAGTVALKSKQAGIIVNPGTLKFVYDPQAQALNYTITDRSWYFLHGDVTEAEIWSGFNSTIAGCR